MPKNCDQRRIDKIKDSAMLVGQALILPYPMDKNGPMKIFLLLIIASSPASAYYNGMEAEKVIGQVNFTQVQACQGGRG